MPIDLLGNKKETESLHSKDFIISDPQDLRKRPFEKDKNAIGNAIGSVLRLI
jgi:hypothetical protein